VYNFAVMGQANKSGYSYPDIDFKSELNDSQYAVVHSADGPCLVLAGAGSGKTRTITYRVAYLLSQGVRPENILLLTFTNKASREMLDRVEKKLGSKPAGLWGGTFHSTGNRILRSRAELLGYQKNFTILDADDSKDLIKSAIRSLGIDNTLRKFPSPAVVSGVLSYAKNSCEPISEVILRNYSHLEDFTDDIISISKAYESKKRSANAMDFDDLLTNWLELLLNHEQVRKNLASQFKYILVDEYQDTNTVQAEIVRLLASEHNNLLVVGDDAQSIYSFRAANVKNILNFPKLFTNSKVFKLETNYRSTPQILNLANAILESNTEQFKKTLVPVIAKGEMPKAVPAQNSRNEAEFIARYFEAMQSAGEGLGSTAVLFRATHHSQMLEMELIRRGIDYEYRGGLRFFERAHIKDILSYLRLVANMKDEVSWLRALGHQKGIGPASAEAVFKFGTERGSWKNLFDSAMEIPARAKGGFESFVAIMKPLVLSEGDVSSMISMIVSSGYKNYIESEFQNPDERLMDIDQFALFAKKYEKDIEKFVEDVSLLDSYGAAQEQRGESTDKTVLSTIHQAKGLEWDTVFILNMVEGGFPNSKAVLQKGGLEEERRLFYVAVTRARKKVIISYPVASDYDSYDVNQPSMFLREIPKSAIDHELGGSFDSEEETIFQNSIGERGKSKNAPMQFLRDIDEL